MNELTNFSLTLTQHRRNKHFTQKEVAKHLGIERSTYAYYERCKTKPSCEFVLLISEIFEVDYSILMDAILKDMNEGKKNTVKSGSDIR